MPVEKDIDLSKPLTDEDLREMEEEATRLEELAENAQDDAKKAKEFQKEEDKLLNEAIKNVEKIEKEADKAEKARIRIGKSVKEVNRLAEHRSAMREFGGEEQFQERDPFGGFGGTEAFAGRLKTGRTGFGTGQEQAPVGGVLSSQAEFEEKMKKALTERKANQKLIQANSKKLAEQSAKIGKVTKGQSDFFAMGRNPLGFAGGRLTGMLAKGGIYGIIALAVISMAQQMFEEVKKLYAPGGPFDIRKEMLDRDREMIEMDQLLARRAGRVFFTSDTSLIQGPPEINAGTPDQVAGRTIRFQNLHLGE